MCLIIRVFFCISKIVVFADNYSVAHCNRDRLRHFQVSSVLLDVNFFRHFILLHKTTTPEVSNISQEINAELTLRQVRWIWAQSPAFVLYSLRGMVCLCIQR